MVVEEKRLYTLALDLAGIFEEFGVDYFLIGGLAVKRYDDYRLTYDVDFVVAPVQVEAGFDGKVAGKLAARLLSWAKGRGLGISTKEHGERLPVSQVTEKKIERALRRGEQTLEFWSESRKLVDIIVGRVGAERFEEVYRVIDGMNVAVPEYIITSKLWLVKKRRAEERDYRDVLRLLAYPELDRERLERYAEELGVSALLERYEKKVNEASAKIRKVVGPRPIRRSSKNRGKSK